MSGFNYSFQRASIDNSYDPEHRNPTKFEPETFIIVIFDDNLYTLWKVFWMVTDLSVVE